jgi:hypothetical protein
MVGWPDDILGFMRQDLCVKDLCVKDLCVRRGWCFKETVSESISPVWCIDPWRISLTAD